MAGKHRGPDTTQVLKAGLAAQQRRAEQAKVPAKVVNMVLESTGNK